MSRKYEPEFKRKIVRLHLDRGAKLQEHYCRVWCL